MLTFDYFETRSLCEVGHNLTSLLNRTWHDLFIFQFSKPALLWATLRVHYGVLYHWLLKAVIFYIILYILFHPSLLFSYWSTTTTELGGQFDLQHLGVKKGLLLIHLIDWTVRNLSNFREGANLFWYNVLMSLNLKKCLHFVIAHTGQSIKVCVEIGE